jgi:hypothetical protein
LLMLMDIPQSHGAGQEKEVSLPRLKRVYE